MQGRFRGGNEHAGFTFSGAPDPQLMRLIDEQFLATPWYGSRQMARHNSSIFRE
jgi:hypothetical protein